MEQFLYKLPEEWQWFQFSEVCVNITDGAHASPKTVEDGFPYVTVKDVNQHGRIDTFNCKRISEADFEVLKKGNCAPPVNSVLLSKDGTVGKVALVTDEYDDFVVLSSLAIITPDQNIIMPEYLRFFLLSPEFQTYAVESKTGAAIKRIVLRTIKNFYIPVPSLNKQKCIVEKLNALLTRIDTTIEHLQQNIELVDLLFKSELNHVFNPLGSIANEDGNYNLPEEWQWFHFSEVCKNVTDGAHASPKTVENGFPYVTVKDVDQHGRIDTLNCKRISETDFELLKKGNCAPPVNSVLLSKDGTVGKVALVTDEYDDFVVLSSLAIITPDQNIIAPEYLKFFLLSPEFQDYAIKSKTGAAITRIVLRTIKNFFIPVPILHKQKRIVEKLDVLQEQCQSARKLLLDKLGYLNALKSSVLDSAFKGEL